MANLWAADVEITPAEAALLIERQFPELAPVLPEPLGVGWDNAAFLVCGRWVFRFPRRKLGAGLLANELRALPVLAPSLPLPIPVPAFVGRPDGDYPYPFAGYALLPGLTACRLVWTENQRAGWAVPLAQFLAALHGVPVSDETRAWAPGDEIHRANIARRAPPLKERLTSLAPLLDDSLSLGPHLEWVDRLVSTPPWVGEAVWVHGDLYPRHLLADEQRRLCGVIDWGDVHLGDPALDLSIAFTFLPPAARGTFRAAYGTIDASTWDRARFRALHYGAVLVGYGADVGDDAIRLAGEYALRVAIV